MDLRDHDQPCEHTGKTRYRNIDKTWRCHVCPGGAVVTIDREAMATVMNVDGWTCDGHEPGAWCEDCKRLQLATVDRMLAALGVKP